VANSASALNSNNGNVWDTNKVSAPQGYSTTCTYAGPALANATTYFWKVMAWDNMNSSGPYSAAASFVTVPGSSPSGPKIAVSTGSLDFGSIEPSQSVILTFDVSNTGGGSLSGTVTSDQNWILVEPESFAGAPATINVTVDGTLLMETQGQYTGTVTITSNGGDEAVTVSVTATCVLPKPNPYNPNKGKLTFFGNGIVQGKTEIKIYTLAGELVKTLDGAEWDGRDAVNGIYLYTYRSPKEKGVGKITVIRR
jgi:hypothetical protein